MPVSTSIMQIFYFIIRTITTKNCQYYIRTNKQTWIFQDENKCSDVRKHLLVNGLSYILEKKNYGNNSLHEKMLSKPFHAYRNHEHIGQ